MSLSGASTSRKMIFVTLLSSVALSWMSIFFLAQPMNLMPVSSELASNLRKIFRRSLSSKQLNAIQKHFSSQSSSLVNMNSNFDFIMLLKKRGRRALPLQPKPPQSYWLDCPSGVFSNSSIRRSMCFEWLVPTMYQ